MGRVFCHSSNTPTMEFTTTCVDWVVIHPYLEGIYSVPSLASSVVIHPYLEGIRSDIVKRVCHLQVVIHPYLEGMRS